MPGFDGWPALGPVAAGLPNFLEAAGQFRHPESPVWPSVDPAPDQVINHRRSVTKSPGQVSLRPALVRVTGLYTYI